jgi:hypothetical protein
VAVDHHPPLRTLAPCGLPDAGPPVFAGAKRPSAKVAAQSSWPGASSWARNPRHTLSHTPWASQSRRRRPQVLGDGNRAGKSCHRAPLLRTQRRPAKTGRFGIGLGPPPGEALSSGHNGAILSHCASVSADCARAIGRTPFAAHYSGSIPPRQPPVVRGYETASRHSARIAVSPAFDLGQNTVKRVSADCRWLFSQMTMTKLSGRRRSATTVEWFSPTGTRMAFDRVDQHAEEVPTQSLSCHAQSLSHELP